MLFCSFSYNLFNFDANHNQLKNSNITVPNVKFFSNIVATYSCSYAKDRPPSIDEDINI